MLETLVNSLFSKRNLPPYLRVLFPVSGLRMKESLPFKKSVATPRERGVLGLSLTMMLTRRRAWQKLKSAKGLFRCRGRRGVRVIDFCNIFDDFKVWFSKPSKLCRSEKFEDDLHLNFHLKSLTMPVPDYLLSESAAGYALYEVKQSEEIGARTREFLETLKDLYTFSRLVNLVSFTPFKNAAHALENTNDISEGPSPTNLGGVTDL